MKYLNNSKALKILTILAVLIMISRISTPYVLAYYLESAYASLGENRQMEIGGIDLSLLRGQIAFDDVSIKAHDVTQHINKLDINIGLLGLFDKKIIIENLAVNGMSIHIIQSESGLMVAGVKIPNTADESEDATAIQPEATRQNSESPWQFHLNKIRFNALRFDIEYFTDQIAFSIEEMQIAELGDNHVQFNAELNLEQLNLPKQHIKLQDTMKITADGEILDMLNQPILHGDIIISNGNLTVPVVQEILFDEIKLTQGVISQQSQLIGLFELNNISINKELVKFHQFIANDISLKNNQLKIAEQSLLGFQLNASIAEDGQLEGVDLNSIQDEQPKDANGGTVKESKSELSFLLPKFEMKESSQINVSNTHLANPLDLTFFIETLTIENVNSQGENSQLILKGKFDKYSSLNLSLDGNVNQRSANIELALHQFNLVPLNGYIEKAIGYHAEQGLADLNLKLDFNQGMLAGRAEISVINSELEPTDEATIDRISKKISMPVATALSLLKDDNNNIQLDIPISGDIRDPDFGINSFITILTTKAIKAASVNYLLQAFFPYNLVISAADYLGGDIFAIRLESIVFDGDNLNDKQSEYLKQIANIMIEKEELQLHVCPLQAKNKAPDNWKKVSADKADHIKSNLIEIDEALLTRIILCKPRLAEKSEIILGF